MRKILLILSLIILISGCGPGGTGIPPPGGIPGAYSDETYTATVTGKGTAPFTCKLVDATSIGGTLNLANNCVISGTAPHADNTRIIAFKVEITDAKDVSNVNEMHLTVHPPGINLDLSEKITPRKAGESVRHGFKATGGSPPYSFTVSGQPMGLIMNLDGVLSGTIPEQATIKDYYLNVCVRDSVGAQKCGKTVLKVTSEPKIEGSSWTGTFKYVNSLKEGAVINHRNEEADFSFTVGADGKITGSGKGKGIKSVTGRCYGEFSYSNVPITVEGEYDKNRPYDKQFKILLTNSVSSDERKYVIECTSDGVEPYPNNRKVTPFPYSEDEHIPLYLSPEDGAKANGLLWPDITSSLATIEIHKVK